MNLKLYLNNSPDNVVDKQIDIIETVSGDENVIIQPTETFSILNPIIILDYNEDYVKANYCYIDVYSRYYYINNITVSTGNRMTIHCSVDVLMTYKESILNTNAVVTRNEGIGKPTFVPDESLPIEPNKMFLKEISFPNQPFNESLDASWTYVIGVRN